MSEMAYENNSPISLRILALIDDQFARMGYQAWPIPMNPQELANEIDKAVLSAEYPRDYGERLALSRKEAGYEQ